MTPTETVAFLRNYNVWRRGNLDDQPMPDPREIGEAIDAAVEMIDRLEAAEKERDECNSRRLEAADHFAAQTALMKEKCDALRAKDAEMERQEPVAWMLNCQTLGGDTGWFLSWTQSGVGMCNRLSGEENERKLYTIPGAQPAPSINPAALSPVINWLRNGCDPMKAADELEMLAASPEARP